MAFQGDNQPAAGEQAIQGIFSYVFPPTQNGTDRYLFIRNFGNGVDSQAQLVRNPVTGEVVLRKADFVLARRDEDNLTKPFEPKKNVEVEFLDEINAWPSVDGLHPKFPRCLSEEYIEAKTSSFKNTTLYRRVSIWEICNGGSVQGMVTGENDRMLPITSVLPLSALARMTGEVLKTVHFLRKASSDPLYHLDVQLGNIACHWEDNESPLPHFLLIDYSDCKFHSETAGGYRFPQMSDFSHMSDMIKWILQDELNVLGKIDNDYKYPLVDGSHSPAALKLHEIWQTLENMVNEWVQIYMKNPRLTDGPDLMPVVKMCQDLEAMCLEIGGEDDETQTEVYQRFVTERRNKALNICRERELVVTATQEEAMNPVDPQTGKPLELLGPWRLVRVQDGVAVQDGPRPKTDPKTGERLANIYWSMKKIKETHDEFVVLEDSAEWNNDGEEEEDPEELVSQEDVWPAFNQWDNTTDEMEKPQNDWFQESIISDNAADHDRDLLRPSQLPGDTPSTPDTADTSIFSTRPSQSVLKSRISYSCVLANMPNTIETIFADSLERMKDDVSAELRYRLPQDPVVSANVLNTLETIIANNMASTQRDVSLGLAADVSTIIEDLNKQVQQLGRTPPPPVEKPMEKPGQARMEQDAKHARTFHDMVHGNRCTCESYHKEIEAILAKIPGGDPSLLIGTRPQDQPRQQPPRTPEQSATRSRRGHIHIPRPAKRSTPSASPMVQIPNLSQARQGAADLTSRVHRGISSFLPRQAQPGSSTNTGPQPSSSSSSHVRQQSMVSASATASSSSRVPQPRAKIPVITTPSGSGRVVKKTAGAGLMDELKQAQGESLASPAKGKKPESKAPAKSRWK